MDIEKITTRIKEILEESKVGVLSTAKDNIPDSRYMWFYNDGLTLYAKTNNQSRKYEELIDNPNVHVLLGFNDEKKHAFVEITGSVEIVKDQEVIENIWEEADEAFFGSVNNPNLVALKVTPNHIKIMRDKNFDEVEIDIEDI